MKIRTAILAAICLLIGALYLFIDSSESPHLESMRNDGMRNSSQKTNVVENSDARLHFFDNLESDRFVAVNPRSTIHSELSKINRASSARQNFQAYMLINKCMSMAKGKPLYVEDESYSDKSSGSKPHVRQATRTEEDSLRAFCSDITELDKRSRLDFLSIAAASGEPEAGIMFLIEMRMIIR